MSETQPSQPSPNETQAWKRELPLHREGAGTLNAEEALALIGSFTESSLERHKDDNETGELTDQQFSVKQRVHVAALEQLGMLEVDENTNALNAIADRRKELETILKTPHGGTRSSAETINLRIALDGVKLLNEMLMSVEDNIDLGARTAPDGNRFSQRNRAAAINELIKQHNKEISPSSESIADSPEIREAQERINARYAEQAKQPQPTETVDDARQKVAEAFGGTGEKERQAFIGEVVRAAKGSARIHTSVTKETKLRFKGREDIAYNDGFSDFGDGLDWGTHNWRENGTFLSDTSEAFIFEPANITRKKTVTETVETGGRFRKKTEQVQKEVADGEVPTMIVNPATGQQEPGVNVRYQFDGNTSNKAWGSRSLERNDLPKYEAPDNNRGGNQLFIEVVLPKSVADSLQQAALRSPDVARQFAQSMVTENGATEATVKMPPYTELPSDWTMTVATLQKDTFSDRGRIHTLRNIASRQDVKV